MLVLSRKVGERIQIGDDIAIVVNRISGNRVTIGVDAPSAVKIIRGELKRFVDDFVEPEKESGTPATLPHTSIGFDDATATAYTPRLAR